MFFLLFYFSSKGRGSWDVLVLGVLEFIKVSELDLEKGLEMRKWVLFGILVSEEIYLSYLEVLLLFMKFLKVVVIIF